MDRRAEERQGRRGKLSRQQGVLPPPAVINSKSSSGGAVAQLGARLDGIEEVVGSNPIGSTNSI